MRDSPVRPISVLHLRDTHEIGGPGKTILETHRAIDRSRVRLSLGVFLSRTESGESPFVSAARECGMPVHFIRGYNGYDPRLVLRVADLVKELSIDIVHAHEVKSDVIAFLASKVRRVPIMTTMHGWIGNGRKQRLFIGLDRRVVRGFDRVIAVSGQIHKELVDAGVTSDRLRLLHNAIVLDRYRRTGQRGWLAQTVGGPVPGPVLVSIGRLSFEKGHADLIEALGVLARRGRRPSLVLGGDGPERGRLVERIRALGLEESVFLLGYLAEPQRLLEEADLMVLPSHTEGLPNAVLEALAMDVPVLATRVGGTPEVVTHGETGWLAPPRDPQAMADAIDAFLADPAAWRQMASRGRAVVEAQFSFDQRTRRLEALYDEVMRRGAA
jgi:glycosyltransferase involved in cell wall biosynthesis